MTDLRRYVTEQLEAKLGRYGVVVWDDPHREYAEVSRDLVPDAAEFAVFEGSWYELRRTIEPWLAQADAPCALVYLPAAPPDEDPLLELRSSGTGYTLRLPTVIKNAVGSEIPKSRVDEVVKTCETLTDAERLLESGGAGPALLTRAFGTGDVLQLLVHVASEPADALNDDAVAQAADFATEQIGGTHPRSAAELSGSVVRHLLLCELKLTLGDLPDALSTAPGTTTSEQLQRGHQALRAWKSDLSRREAYIERVRAASDELELAKVLTPHERLSELDSSPAYEDLAFEVCMALVDSEEYAAAEDLAEERKRSLWSDPEIQDDEWRQRWEVMSALSALRGAISEADAQVSSATEAIQDYAASVWAVDSAHRHLEHSLLYLADPRPLEEAATAARQDYERWLDGYLRAFTAAVERDGIHVEGMLRQGEVHKRRVEAVASREPTALLVVDALRYEVGQELASILRRTFDEGDVTIEPAVGLLPSITPVGMANLCPGADGSLELTSVGEKLEVRIDGSRVMTVPERVARLRSAHGEVLDLLLDDVFQAQADDLRQRVEHAGLVLVRSQEIDQAGESGKLNAAYQSLTGMVDQIARAIARLTHAGVRRFVIASDHGFIILSRKLGDSMTIPKPGGKGEVHRRAFVGKGGAAGDALVRLAGDRLGVPSELDVLVPRGLAVIAAHGDRGFFHGGCSPQELVVPVISVAASPEPSRADVAALTVTISPKITSQIFTGTVELGSNLFSEPTDVRVMALRAADGLEVGTLVTAGGAEAGRGLVQLKPGGTVNLGLRVIRDLQRGDEVELHVLDAKTDRRLGHSKPAKVARGLEVEDDLGA